MTSTPSPLLVYAAADLHGFLPEVPPCDLLLLAGDLVPVDIQDDPLASRRWFGSVFRDWLIECPARRIVAVAGNHDALMEARGLLPVDLPWTVLYNESVVVDGLKIWGTPHTMVHGDWSFEITDAELHNVLTEADDDIDIIVSHGPPFGYGDRVPRAWGRNYGDGWEDTGSKSLRDFVHHHTAQLCVFGHVHECGGWQQKLPNGTVVANVSLRDARFEVARRPAQFSVQPRVSD